MFRALRIIAVLHAISLFLQPVLAGLFLSGRDGTIDIHSQNGSLVTLLGLVQAVLAFLCFRRKLVTVDKVLGPSIGIFVLEVVQLFVGFGHLMWLHIPLGVFLVAGTAVLMNDLKTARPAASAAGPDLGTGSVAGGAEAPGWTANR